MLPRLKRPPGQVLPRSTKASGTIRSLLIIGFGALWLVSGLAGELDGKLTMDEVVQRALAANPMLKAAAARWAAFKERVPQVRAWEDPMIGVDFERTGTTRFDTYSDAEWMVSQSVPISGKNLSRGRAAEAEARAAYEEVRRRRLEITAKARVAYYRLANAHAQLRINQENRALFENTLAVGTARFSAGRGTQAEVLAANADLQKLAIERESLEQTLSEQQTALNVAMNRRPGAPVGSPAALAFQPLRTDSAQLEARLLALRPEIAAAEQRRRAEQARLELAHRQWIPDPQLRVEARHFRGSSDVFTEYDTGIFFSVPWVNQRKYSAGVREAQQMVESTQRELEGERLSALGILRDQLQKIRASRRQYEFSRDKLLPLARQSAQTLRINYEAGTSTLTEWLAIQRMVRETESSTSTQLTGYLTALAELESIVGSDPKTSSAAFK